MSHVIFLAAENGALPGGKVGGVGDVIRDLPRALARKGWRATVVMPSYGKHYLGLEHSADLEVTFRGKRETVSAFVKHDSVDTVVLHHAGLQPGAPGEIYHDDGDGHLFATDANTFALFGTAAAVWVSQLDEPPDVVHLHDWHAAFYLMMRDFTGLHASLWPIRTVFTIHNLAYQGQRPFQDDESSLVSWFPGMQYDEGVLQDPTGTWLNPMAYAIRSADAVTTVSPSYAREICQPTDKARGFFGGDGLEEELSNALSNGRLRGILNGCEYSGASRPPVAWTQLVSDLHFLLNGWPSSETNRLALTNIERMPEARPRHVVTSIGRAVSQKLRLFMERLPDGRTAIEHICERLGDEGTLLLIGSGDPEYELALTRIAARCPNLIFICGYAEAIAKYVYQTGDLFLMPSSFEPCGISQLLAMREGQPCVVHGVGGLRDTVKDGETGFVFYGDSPADQAQHFVQRFGQALTIRETDPDAWSKIRQAAANMRFPWDAAADTYVAEVYEHPERRREAS